ncbi:unnamed protein product [Caenorhabditis sp. 36 PRJEB53466]|nr:unnamed protein product [Caenorhabditis sp. 36 PRJEB53466]
MEEEHEEGQSGGVQGNAPSEDGPGKEYELYVKNEELVDKLKLLNYEDGFLKLGAAYKPILKHYFVKSRNVGEQFFLFTSLAAWLIRKSGDDSYNMPLEFDDPNSTLANIMAAAKIVPLESLNVLLLLFLFLLLNGSRVSGRSM